MKFTIRRLVLSLNRASFRIGSSISIDACWPILQNMVSNFFLRSIFRSVRHGVSVQRQGGHEGPHDESARLIGSMARKKEVWGGTTVVLWFARSVQSKNTGLVLHGLASKSHSCTTSGRSFRLQYHATGDAAALLSTATCSAARLHVIWVQQHGSSRPFFTVGRTHVQFHTSWPLSV